MKNQFLKATVKLFLSALVVLSVSLPSFAYRPQQEKMSKMSTEKVEKGKMSKMKADSGKKTNAGKPAMSKDKMSKSKM